jgi:hypothetical protein
VDKDTVEREDILGTNSPRILLTWGKDIFSKGKEHMGVREK